MKYGSRKFIVFCITHITFIVLSFLGKIGSIEVLVGILVNSFIYTFFEGVIDISKVKKIQFKDFYFEGGRDESS